MNYEFNLDITPGGMPPVLHMSQYDTFRTFTANLKQDGGDFTPGLGATAKVKGFNGKVTFEIDCTISGSAVTFQLTAASTDQFGIFPVTIEMTIGSDTLSPLCMIFDVQRAGYTNEQAASSPEFENAMEEAAKKYVLGMDEAARVALLDLLAYAAYTGPDAQAKFDVLETALQAKLSYIVADYVQDRAIYDTDSLDVLKEGDDLIVTAYYDDGTHIDLADSAYTLTGTLVAPSSTITVGYRGKTDTIDVTVMGVVMPEGYTRYSYIYCTKTSGTVTSGAWIRLPDVTNLSALKLRMLLERTEEFGENAFLGVRNTSDATTSYSVYLGNVADSANKIGVWLNGVKTYTAQGINVDGKPHLLEVDPKTQSPGKLSLDGVSVDINYTDEVTIPHGFVILTNPQYNYSSGMSISHAGRSGDIVLFDQSGNLVGYFVPCVYNGRIGIYDGVSQTFHTSSTASYTTIGNSGCIYAVGNWS